MPGRWCGPSLLQGALGISCTTGTIAVPGLAPPVFCTLLVTCPCTSPSGPWGTAPRYPSPASPGAEGLCWASPGRGCPSDAATGWTAGKMEHFSAVKMKLENIPITRLPFQRGTRNGGTTDGCSLNCRSSVLSWVTLSSVGSLMYNAEAVHTIRCSEPYSKHADQRDMRHRLKEDSLGQCTGSKGDTAMSKGSPFLLSGCS